MNPQTKQALSDQFADIDTVRSVRVIRDEYLAVYTWSGVVIHVYGVDEPIKARTVKRIVQENTRVGIGTLFIVSAEIVPEDGAQVEPDEGLLALHALFKDKLYTYRFVDGQLKIGQVHFKVYSRGDLREVWYGPDIPARHLPCYRVWVTAPQTIKGNWLIANFGSEAFWKQADYTAGRDAFRREQRRAHGSTQYYTWNHADWSNVDPPGYSAPASPPPPPPESELDRSFKLLGLPRNASGDEVKAAFRRLAREVHPDVSQLPKDEAEVRFQILYAAYAYIKSAKGW
ncbi:MAG TPA: J domain-containing protein [Phototrophicaceae bacterium]|nr:J domain-containing protein [Phototrophicaceae bacterium]